MKIYSDAEIARTDLSASKIGILGFGSQGRAQAANLRDSGLDVVVGLRDGSPTRPEALEAGFTVATLEETVDEADVVAFLIPDERQGEVFGSVAGRFREGQALLFAHGFAVHFGFVEAPPGTDVIMASPKGPGPRLRAEYLRGSGLVTLVAVHRNHTGRARERALGYAAAIGGSRAGILDSTFADECETDLFGEQAVICGGLSHLIQAGFETLVEAGYPEEMAYFECLHEAKFVADLIQQRGIAGMRRAISNTAKYGDVLSGPRVIGPEVKAEMKKVLEDIRSGSFARQWTGEIAAGAGTLRSLLGKEEDHPIEKVGARLRALMGIGDEAPRKGLTP